MGLTTGGAIGKTAGGDLTLTASSNFVLTGTGNGLADAGLSNYSVGLTKLSDLSISSVSGSNTAITTVDAALAQVNSMRADMGALQNRFTTTVSSLQTASLNISAARSRIQDTDYAAETAALVRGQILQQAGTAMLAQANQLPNLVLSLLK
ncbi:A-type flagellin [mine drainage metagenome]|uniref:A-type flagellin n=1 Tax=mine drainage metagenome TaxID=410659 RepID=A0A1J5R8I6_9ZZZZ